MTIESIPRSGFGYFIFGIKIALSPSIRKFVLLPLIANVLLVGGRVVQAVCVTQV